MKNKNYEIPHYEIFCVLLLLPLFRFIFSLPACSQIYIYKTIELWSTAMYTQNCYNNIDVGLLSCNAVWTCRQIPVGYLRTRILLLLLHSMY
jgi:hypothetical protein